MKTQVLAKIRRTTCAIVLAALASLALAQPEPHEPTYALRDLDIPPKLLKPVRPVYPFNMLAGGVEGKVTVEYVVSPSGQVAEVHVVESNNPWFERPALDAVLQWKFSPGKVNGRAVITRVQQQVTFSLQGVPGDNFWALQRAKHPESLPPELRWELPPEAVHSMFPVYPFADLLAGRTGKATVRFLIDETGAVLQSRLLSAATPEMGQAALAAIDGWRFKPARRADGAPSMALLAIAFEFEPYRGDVPVPNEARRLLSEIRRGGKNLVELSNLDAAPQPLSRRPPVYPSSLQEKGQAGHALIEFYIDTRGDAQLPRVVEASAPEFGYAAAQAVATWRFKPPRQKGKVVVARVQVPVSFSVE